MALVILREIRGQRLQGGRYPTRQEHLSASACDAAILVEIADNWDCGWQIPYVVMRIAARGLYAHPDVPDMVVQGVRIASHVEEVLQFVTRRGYALGLLEAEVCGRYEAPWIREEPHPLLALQDDRGVRRDGALRCGEPDGRGVRNLPPQSLHQCSLLTCSCS